MLFDVDLVNPKDWILIWHIEFNDLIDWSIILKGLNVIKIAITLNGKWVNFLTKLNLAFRLKVFECDACEYLFGDCLTRLLA